MFIELTHTDPFSYEVQKILVSTSHIVSAWPNPDNTTKIYTVEDNSAFKVDEPYDSIKFLLQMTPKGTI